MRSWLALSKYFTVLVILTGTSCGKVITQFENRNASQRTGQIFESRGDGDVNLGPVTDFQCPSGEKVSPHPYYCDLYYTCYANDAVTLWQCYSDYLFDLTFYGCNFPYLVNCGNRLPPDARTTSSSSTTTEQITTEPTTSSSVSTSTERPTTTTEPSTTTQEIVTTTNEPVRPAPTFTCPTANGFFPISAESCTQHYYGCVNGVAYLLRCPGDTYYYDPVMYSCETAADVSCSSDFFNCSSQFPNGFYPIPGTYCTNVYFSCKDGQLTEKVCPGTALFDVSRNLCAPADTVQCYLDLQTTVTSDPLDQQTTTRSPDQQTTSSSSDQQTSYSNPPDQATTTIRVTSTTPAINSYCVENPNGNVAYPFDCHKYVQCIGGVGYLSVCPSGTCYSEANGSCTSSCPTCP